MKATIDKVVITDNTETKEYYVDVFLTADDKPLRSNATFCYDYWQDFVKLSAERGEAIEDSPKGLAAYRLTMIEQE